jgi:glucose-1-phosphate thymidylyltransferase
MNHSSETRLRHDVAPVRKAIILARGLGKRMRQADDAAALDSDQLAIAAAGIKALLPVGRPFLDYVLSALSDSAYTQVCLVIGPEHQAVRDYYVSTAPPQRIELDFAVQHEPRGTADAVLAAEPFVAGEDFLVINSDNYYPLSALRALRTLGEPGTVLFQRDALIRESNIPAERIRSYALCRIGGDDYLEDIYEKPDDDTQRSVGNDAFVSMNIWRFSPAIFEPCRRVVLSPRGEFELPLAVRTAVQEFGLRLRALKCYEGVLDLSCRADIAAVTKSLSGILPVP